MLISAVLSEATQDFEHLKKSASCFGRAFQIVKEINTFSADKVLDYNIVSALLWKNASADEKKELRKLYTSVRNPDNLSETHPVIHKIKKYDILRKAAGYAHDFKETGISALINTRIQDNVQDDIADFIESLIVVKLPGI
jgi:geranylgeranyl pyrophosphate synthase